MRSLVVLPFIWLLFMEHATAQIRVHYNPPNHISTDLRSGRVLVGPDPDLNEHLYGMLADPDVRLGLGFTEDQDKLYHQAIFMLQVAYDPANPIREDRHREMLAAMEEIVTPAQLARLKTLAFRYEISVIGLPRALASGRLGDEVGVYPNQHERILRVGAEIDARLQEEIRQLRKAAETQLLKELSPEQRQKAEQVLGEYFLHRGVRSLTEIYEQKVSELQTEGKEKSKLPSK
jgi:hypothetical protein